MPRIGELLGIFFYLYFREHGITHIHAIYQNQVVVLTLDGTILEGKLPAKKLKLARKFVVDNADLIEQMSNNIEESKAGKRTAPKTKNLTKSKK